MTEKMSEKLNTHYTKPMCRYTHLFNILEISKKIIIFVKYFICILGMLISVIFPNRQPTLVNRLLTVNQQDYFKLELN